MKVICSQEIESREINQENVKNVRMKALITKEDGAPVFSLRSFELGINGYTPYHNHPWEHEVYILEGKGELICKNGSTPLLAGNAVFVPGEEYHQFRNNGDKPFKFLCIVPNEGHK